MCSLSPDNEGLDETIRSTDLDIDESYDKASRFSPSGQLTPGSGGDSDCGPFGDVPAAVPPLEHPGEDYTVDSLFREPTWGSDNGTSADEIVESVQRSVHFESDALSPEHDLPPSVPGTMIITGHGDESIEISNIRQGDNAVFFFGSDISEDLMETLLAHRSS
ncbi:hypothetical protein FANTH_12259 [Fusarium anthophilum]|uniref:Uncharacterized protein n=1 Tax=Fusarium anthophilum TaxID=48485 RepID=A0A8H5DSN5_9HYPO|nr:hypothetical protein FANTH_12259 [Fusarium anthophilum]